jgi:hypothetical protein
MLGTFVEAARNTQSKVKANSAESSDFSELVQTYNSMIESFNGFTDRYLS